MLERLARLVSLLEGRPPLFGDLTVDLGVRLKAEAFTLTIVDGRLEGARALEAPRNGGAVVVASSNSSVLLPQPKLGEFPWDEVRRWSTVEADGGRTRGFPPDDLFAVNWHGLSDLPGVDVSWSSTEVSSLFGELTVSYVVRNGRLDSMSRLPLEDPDAWFRYRSENAIRSRSGDSSVVEVLADGGELGGDLDAAMLIGGLLDMEEWSSRRRIPEAHLQAVLRLYELGRFPAGIEMLNSTWSSLGGVA